MNPIRQRIADWNDDANATSPLARETRSGMHWSMPIVDVTTIDSNLLLRRLRI